MELYIKNAPIRIKTDENAWWFINQTIFINHFHSVYYGNLTISQTHYNRVNQGIRPQLLSLLIIRLHLLLVPDIAVGAPYEGTGAVYIYHGDKTGILFEPVQKILAENIDPRLKGFGISFSNVEDIDGNHYDGNFMFKPVSVPDVWHERSLTWL